jgi:F5/8 type C domain/FG-GAP repeat
MIIVSIKRNTTMSVILAGVLLISLITSIPYSVTQAIVIPNDAYAQKSSTDVNSSSITTPFDASPNSTSENDAMHVVNNNTDSNKTVTLESRSNNTVFSENQFKNESNILSDITNKTANVNSISSAVAEGSPKVSADFNGDGSDDLAIGVPFENEEIGGTILMDLPITSITASGNDGNLPQNVLDGNLGTRWSSLGVGQFITADLGSTQKISDVDIAWYKGNARQYHFVIATSIDGNTFINRLSRDSSGTTTSSETYGVPSIDARYLRVTVNGNTQNDWASITELDILGPSASHTVVDSGAVNIIYGTSKGLSATAISSGNGRADQIWTQAITGGIEPGDLFGSSLATGDFNKDGYSDLAIGVPREDFGTITDAGAVNVIYASSDGLSPVRISLGNGRADQIWTQDSLGVEDDAVSRDLFDFALTTGDFNKDGISDLAIGVPLEDVGTPGYAGAVNVIYGSVRTDIPMGGLSATVPIGGNGRADQIWTQDSLGIEDNAEGGDQFGSALG